MYGVIVMNKYDGILNILAGFDSEEQAQVYIQRQINNTTEPYNVEYDGYSWTVRGADDLTYHIGPVEIYEQPLTLSGTFTEIPLKNDHAGFPPSASEDIMENMAEETREELPTTATLEQRITAIENQLHNVWGELSHVNNTMLNTFERARKAF